MLEKIPINKPKTEKQDVREIIFEEVAELELPIKIIIEKIKSRIENGEYGLIVGDDASGRIPTLILGNFIKKVSELKEVNTPNIIFIPGKLISISIFDKIHTKKLEEHLSKHGATKDKRILIVTDTIKTGASLEVLVRLIKKSGYACDIAVIGLEYPDNKNDLKQRSDYLKGVEIISGEYEKEDSDYQENPNTPMIYRKHILGGVYKVMGRDVSRRLKPERSRKEAREIQDSVNQAREDAGVVTNNLVNWYETLKNEK